MYVDLVGLVGEEGSGLRYILAVENEFTRYGVATPKANKESQTVARALIDQIIMIS